MKKMILINKMIIIIINKQITKLFKIKMNNISYKNNCKNMKKILKTKNYLN